MSSPYTATSGREPCRRSLALSSHHSAIRVRVSRRELVAEVGVEMLHAADRVALHVAEGSVDEAVLPSVVAEIP